MAALLAEKPFAGAVFCFTSVSTDLRTEYADYAVEMGAEHKLDLTSDVTHLLVGDTDTAKYKYVAREREDIKVLRPEYVPAVRTKWMAAQTVDIAALEHEYRLPPFHGLKICITGFDDLKFRQQLQQNIVENGGQYSGDLTKEVTHLIAVQAQGKKYEYATHWQTKVVSLKWYKDTLSRGMQLDESLYHPAKPIDEQGAGAWNRHPETKQNLGKRQRPETAAAAAPRKLRRTASSRLGSQTDKIWSNIVNPPPSDDTDKPKPPLRQSKSMPGLQADSTSPQNEPSPLPQGWLTGKQFLIARFDQQKSLKLAQIITALGGTVANSSHQIHNTDGASASPDLLMVPWKTASEDLPHVPGAEIVSELWLEYCMEQKAFIPPSDYLYGSLQSAKRLLGFSQLSIASNGFAGIQLRHLSKIVVALGARYSEVFDSSTSLLICKASPENPNRKMKMRRARAWAIPVVSEQWLEVCIQNQRKLPLEPYLLQPWRAVVGPEKMPDANKSDNCLTTVMHQDLNDGRREDGDRPLKEISPNLPRKQASPEKSVKPKKRLFKTANGPSNLHIQIQSLAGGADPGRGTSASPSPSVASPSVMHARILNGEIQDLLNFKARAKAASIRPSRASSVDSMNTDGIGSEIGLVTGQSQEAPHASMAATAAAGQQHSFTGRAKSRLLDGTPASAPPPPIKLTGMSDSAISVSIEDLSCQHQPGDDQPPPLTQLVYDDPDEAILLREKLAAKRRARGRLGQKLSDPRPELKDDDILVTSGWAVTGRTRSSKVKSPERLDGF
ncbi:hypothetical protein DV735_g170, partial [Chaetothyriales sp. CBS 134920]